MAVESATYISDLTPANPAAGGNVSEGDDHLRLLKTVLKATFPNVSAAVNATASEINYNVGVTSLVQTQLNTLSAQVGEPYTWVSKSGAYTASNGDAVLADTSGGVWTLTLPISPTAGNAVRVADVAGTFDTNNLTIGRNGSKINGLAEDMGLDIGDVSVLFVYTGSTYGWRAL